MEASIAGFAHEPIAVASTSRERSFFHGEPGRMAREIGVRPRKFLFARRIRHGLGVASFRIDAVVNWSGPGLTPFRTSGEPVPQAGHAPMPETHRMMG